jgi:hypothetical protein
MFTKQTIYFSFPLLRVSFQIVTYGSSSPFFSGLFYDVPCACSSVFTVLLSRCPLLYFAFSPVAVQLPRFISVLYYI